MNIQRNETAFVSNSEQWNKRWWIELKPQFLDLLRIIQLLFILKCNYDKTRLCIWNSFWKPYLQSLHIYILFVLNYCAYRQTSWTTKMSDYPAAYIDKSIWSVAHWPYWTSIVVFAICAYSTINDLFYELRILWSHCTVSAHNRVET